VIGFFRKGPGDDFEVAARICLLPFITSDIALHFFLVGAEALEKGEPGEPVSNPAVNGRHRRVP
jgi:hypothetical protein